MKFPHASFLLAALFLPILPGCATIFHGTSSEIAIQSEPGNAKFRVVSTGGGVTSTKGVEYASGLTPAKVTLSQKSEYVVYIKAPGYEEAKIPVQQTLNGWFICSGLCGLVPGGIDALTGGMWNLEPEQISVSLVPLQGAAPMPDFGAPAPAAPAAPTSVFREQGTTLYAVLRARGADGQIRYTAIPLLPEVT